MSNDGHLDVHHDPQFFMHNGEEGTSQSSLVPELGNGESVTQFGPVRYPSRNDRVYHDEEIVDPTSRHIGNNLNFIEPIGSGSMGDVFLALYQGDKVCVKCVRLGSEDESVDRLKVAMDCFIKEFQILETKRSMHIVKVFSYCPNRRWIVMEYCPNGNLYNFIRNPSEKARCESWELRLKWLIQVAKAMVIYHDNAPTVLHRDLKSSSILLDADYNAKVGGFGYSIKLDKLLGESASAMNTALGMTWQPLEVMNRKQYSTKSDVYSFGVIMQEVMLLEAPFGLSEDDPFFEIRVENYIREGGILQVPDDRQRIPGEWHPCLEDYIKLMHECCLMDPQERPEFESICNRLKTIKKTYEKRNQETSTSTTRESGSRSLIQSMSNASLKFLGNPLFVSIAIFTIGYITSRKK